MKTNLYDTDNASFNVRNVLTIGEKTLFGYTIHIDEIVEGFYYTNKNGGQSYMSARYHGYIIDPDGTRVELNTKAKTRGGWIARHCGLWVTKEKDAMTKHGDLYEVTNRNIIED